MKKKGIETQNTKIRYSIGLKLVVIISILILFSLSLITVLVSMMVSNDVRVTAEDNNFTINKRSAEEAETSLNTIRSNALVLLETLNAAGNSPALSRQAAAFFFERNQDIAAIVIAAPPAEGAAAVSFPIFLANERFFLSNEIDSTLAESFITDNVDAVERAAAGETLLLNATPTAKVALLALFYLWQESGSGEAVVIFFSSDALSESLGSGTNSSFMINGEGDVLVHANQDLVKAGANVGYQSFIQSMRENTEERMQTLYTDEDGKRYFGAFTKLSQANVAVITNIEYDVVFEGVVATTRRNIYLTIAVIFASVIFIRIFSLTISKPLNTLTKAAEQIEGGQFEIVLQPKTRDEIGALTASFDRMSKALGIFGRFTNREIAVRAMRGEIKPGGQPKHATIFFSDIRDFTKKSENFTKKYGEGASERIVFWLNDYFTRMVECVEKTGGVVDKFIGDAVMAHWGTAYTTGSPEEDAFNCVKAALMMRWALMDMNRGRDADDFQNPPIRIGCGINTGIVTAGQIGSEQRMEYTAIGDPVNLASRTEALNKPLGTDILITEDTWKLTGSRFITEEMPSVQVKGKEKPVRLFAVINMKENSVTGEGPQTLADVRKLLGIPDIDVSKVDTEADEKKYKIGSKEKGG
ncbi:MAG: HAMP domain-containing protein [Treponema sp.]|jgi:adenylate cyclase|nr:HAMP domain-containing protein [Treponema sp.]